MWLRRGSVQQAPEKTSPPTIIMMYRNATLECPFACATTSL